MTDITVEPGDAFRLEELSDLDHFLTARFRLYAALRGRLSYAQVEHAPWPLKRARAVHLEQTLTAAARLPAPEGDPLIHYSDDIHVRVAAPQTL